MIYENVHIKRHNYKAFGLNLLSDFVFNEMFESDSEAEIELVFGKTPVFLPGDTSGFTWYQGCENHMLIHVENVARFYIADGKRITIEPFHNVKFSTIKLYLFGVAFAPLLFQRGNFPLHGGALNINGKGIIISGDSGAGKSTLSLALMKKGFSLISDDISVLSNYEDDIYVNSSYRLQKISHNTAINFGMDVSQLEKIEDEEKYYLPLGNDEFSHEVPLTALYELVPSDCNDVYIEEISGSNKLMTLIHNTYYLQFIDCLELSNEHFKFCSNLANKIKVFRIYRPKSGFSVEQQIRLLMNSINNV